MQDATTGSSFSGFFKTCTTGTADSEGSYFALPGQKDLTALDWLVGYKLEFKVDFPHTYYRQDRFVDETAYVVIHRYKFSLGLSGQCTFKITPNNQPQVEFDASTIRGNEYQFDTVPIETRAVEFTVPIMQRNKGFDLQMFSDNPYIVSVNSAMWEGNYSPKFYRDLNGTR